MKALPNQGKHNPLIVQALAHGTMREENHGLASVRWIIEELEKLNSTIRLPAANLLTQVRRETFLAEKREIGGPFVFQRRWHHHDDWPLSPILQRHGHRYRKGHESLAHADFVREDQAGLLAEPF
jgi:hypothetical protein